MIGKTIGPFEVVEQIAKGSLGILYRAFDKRMRREGALRLFDEDITSHQEAAMQFAFEIELASNGGVAGTDHDSALARPILALLVFTRVNNRPCKLFKCRNVGTIRNAADTGSHHDMLWPHGAFAAVCTP